jgi:RNA polymerase sigma-70 factor (ECF subfamily)
MASGEATGARAEILEPARIEEYRAYLMRYALLQLRDPTAAEDAVQETLLAALQSASYAGRSSLKTWLTGILRHKIVDHVRRQAREQPLERPDEEPGDSDIAETLFADDGHWHDFPSDWDAPDRSFESSEFWKVFEICVQVMPARMARVFVMRELLELTTEEICKELGVTATNCWVMLHRARLALRECLETKWFKT